MTAVNRNPTVWLQDGLPISTSFPLRPLGNPNAMIYLKALIRGIFWLFAPFILIVIGAGLVVAGFWLQWMFLVWTGVVVIATGIIWIAAYLSDADIF